ncbi:hypothetical protein KSP40_PGU015666 [Platanthera guangdongensis]|uniref:Decapping nuclease n=1 Tax=Platanthera guangdongensis TaxID=2320717 RepID=A0ABR2MUG4_9ASPA
MDFSEQDVDIFGDDFGRGEEEEEDEQPRGGDDEEIGSPDSSGSSSASSSSSSSCSSSARSSSLSSSEGGNEDAGEAADSASGRVDDEDLEEEEGDLFGPDNEDYVRTPARSPFTVPVKEMALYCGFPKLTEEDFPDITPLMNFSQSSALAYSRGKDEKYASCNDWRSRVLPSIRITNNHTRGSFGRGRGGLLPRPGYPPRQNYGFGNKFSFGNGRHDERFVSELRLTKSEETLSRKSIQFQEPCELACYSRVEGGDVYFDDRSLRLFKRLVSEDVGADLNKGFASFVEKKDLGSDGFGDLLACIRNANIPLQNIHFVTFRNNLNKIMATAYIRNEPWKMGVHKRNGLVYLDVHKLPERPQSEIDRRRCYWGYAFENLATENSGEMGEDGKGIDANMEFCSVIKTKLGAHRVLMGAEMDCCDSTDDGRKFYVELKTSRELDRRTEERYEREKLLKFWIQSFLAGVPYIVVGYRYPTVLGVFVLISTPKLIDAQVKSKNLWHQGPCHPGSGQVWCWLAGEYISNKQYHGVYCLRMISFCLNLNQLSRAFRLLQCGFECRTCVPEHTVRKARGEWTYP